MLQQGFTTYTNMMRLLSMKDIKRLNVTFHELVSNSQLTPNHSFLEMYETLLFIVSYLKSKIQEKRVLAYPKNHHDLHSLIFHPQNQL